jgi:hypothetical protein
VDLDRDGRRDILSGSYSRMDNDMAGLFQVLYGNPDGTFRKAEVLKGTDGEPLIIPLNGRAMTENICTRPFAIDWDGDGHLDLVVGTFAGSFYLFKGEGDGKFLPKSDQIMSGGKPLMNDGYHGDPFVIDWDGDGDLDILSGSAGGGVQWSENLAGPGQPPRLEPFRWLIEHGPRVEYGQILRDEDLKGPSGDTRVWVDDVNSDGKLDLLVGDDVTLISPADGLDEQEFKTRFADWQKALDAVQKRMAVLNGEREPQNVQERDPRVYGLAVLREVAVSLLSRQAQKHFQEVYGQRAQFMKEDRTGFVWLYLRK